MLVLDFCFFKILNHIFESHQFKTLKKSCLNNVCTTDLSAPTGSCLFGDDIVTSPVNSIVLSSNRMDCASALAFLATQGQDPVTYCLGNENVLLDFKSKCCKTCSCTF